jgi:CBS domain-containing protein
MLDKVLVQEVMLVPGQFPILSPKALMVEALEIMSEYRLGIVCIADEMQKLVGVFTDGDLRRLLIKHQKPLPFLMNDDLSQHMSSQAKATSPDTPVSQAVALMEDWQIWDLPVIRKEGELSGLLHLHPVIDYMLKTAN